MLGITWLEAGAVALATVGMYVAMVLLVRLLGQRMLSGMSSYDLAAVIAFGGIIARAALGDAPRLGGGLVALVTLVLLQAASGVVRRTRLGALLVVNRPVLLMVGETVLERHMRRCHVSHAELHSRLRQAGVGHPSQVAAVVFEASGTLSVVRAGQELDPALFGEVRGGELLAPVPVRGPVK
nr:YetF domain-containing protein [Microbacterium excoecariae]